MQKNFFIEKGIKAKTIGNRVCFEKEGIILDKICSSCQNPIFEGECECGKDSVNEADTAFWRSIFAVWIFMGIVFLFAFRNIEKTFSVGMGKLNAEKIDFNSVAPINIQMIAELDNSKYRDFIQNIYTRKKSQLIILIKPNLWNALSEREKAELLDIAQEKWDIVYKRNNPDSNEKLTVEFGNFYR